MHSESYSKAVRDAVKKIRKRTLDTPPPTNLGECIPGDVIMVPWLDCVQIVFHISGKTAIRQWAPPTRDRVRRARIQMLDGTCGVKLISCYLATCKERGLECPACDGSQIVGLWY